MSDLARTVHILMTPGKGLLAADESNLSCAKRFEALNIPCTETTRRNYRELLFTTPHLSQYISGVILFDETIRQKSVHGPTLVDLLQNANIIPGIKVDKGVIDLDNFPDEKITEGLDGLKSRAEEYYKLGARFAKWRAVIKITNNLPTPTAILANTEVLARYSAICQTAGLVPIVEPEVLFEGNHSLERCEHVTTEVLKALFHDLQLHKVDLSGLILKSSFVLAGQNSSQPSSADDIARATLRTFKTAVPHQVNSIVFLSNRQTPIRSTENLQAIANLGPQPWPITFSYSRALQQPALEAWAGETNNTLKAQSIFLQRTHLNSLASLGKYSSEFEPLS
jgi:fructose-bisphosphate aldolase class I